jgi:hypothetical protein
VAPGRAALLTLALNLAAFAVPAAVAWNGALEASVVLPGIAFVTSVLWGLGALGPRESRRQGAAVLGAAAGSAVLEVLLALALVAAYSASHPGWDLS